MKTEAPGSHLTAEEVAASLDRALDTAQQARLDAHLADCPDCRREVTEVRRLLRRPAWQRWSVMGPIGVAAAAVLALVIVPSGPEDGEPARLRSGDEAVPRFAVVAPLGDQPLPPDSLRFTWRSAGPNATYRLTVTEPDGDVVVRRETRDTTVVVIRSEGIVHGSQYFWYVDALLVDGASATTGVHQVSTVP
jgi:hypothetical protein